jgi:hypothetical protein
MLCRFTEGEAWWIAGMVNKQLLSQKLTGQLAVTADWEDQAIKLVRRKLLADNTPEAIAAAFARFDVDHSGTGET